MNISEWIAFARENWKKEEGQTMAEYGVVLAVITLAVIAAITLLGGNISNAINSVANIMPIAPPRSSRQPATSMPAFGILSAWRS